MKRGCCFHLKTTFKMKHISCWPMFSTLLNQVACVDLGRRATWSLGGIYLCVSSSPPETTGKIKVWQGGWVEMAIWINGLLWMRSLLDSLGMSCLVSAPIRLRSLKDLGSLDQVVIVQTSVRMEFSTVISHQQCSCSLLYSRSIIYSTSPSIRDLGLWL